MPATRIIAIGDVGKTNKKFFLFDENYQIIWQNTVVLPETKDEDGDACEDSMALESWLRESFKNASRAINSPVNAINFSAYGATLVNIHQNGTQPKPIYNYLKPYPEKMMAGFYTRYGGSEFFSQQTASPVLGSLNSGMQLYRLKTEKQAYFNSLKYSLHLPQWLSWKMTGIPYSETTSIGCHTQLWDFKKQGYHDWVYQEGIFEKLAPIEFAGSVQPMQNLPGFPVRPDHKIHVGTGLHDSSAAMIPYLAKFKESFMLVSTGTWCINMNPFNHEPLTLEELKNDCLNYMTFEGRAVKSSRVFAGRDHELGLEFLSGFFHRNKEYYHEIDYDPGLVKKLRDKNFTILSGQETNMDDLRQRDLSRFQDFDQAYHQLMLDIVDKQTVSINKVLSSGIDRIFVDGGFSRNSIFMHLLAKSFPQLKVYAATMAEASALGAGLAIHDRWNENPLPANLIELKLFEHMD